MDKFASFTNPSELSAKKIFDNFGGSVTKRFGQNFLFDEKITGRIVAAAGDLTDKTVMEVGPGPGGLTLEILKLPIKRLYVIEIDNGWAQFWRSIRGQFDGKLEVIEQDALQLTEATFSPQIIISNLPYNISSKLLLKWLRHIREFDKLVLMFQKEVADRLCAKPSTKSYGRLSVLTQWKSHVEKIFDLEPGCFFPSPKVKSTVVRLIPRHDAIEDFDFFSCVLSDAFLHRRKYVSKSLAVYHADIEQVLLKFGYDSRTRAEEISVEDYRRIFSAFTADSHGKI